MDRSDYLRLEEAVRSGDSLESLSVLRAVLDKVVDDVSGLCPKDDLEQLSRSIKFQRLIYEKAVALYEGMQIEGAERDGVVKCLEDFDQSLHEYYTFSRSPKAPAPGEG